jgi:uncharacterized protein YbcI
MVPAATKTKADVEYQVMLAVLNFHRDYLALHYSRVRIQMIDNVIEVTLAPRRPIPAEQLLAQSPEGRVQLQQMHTAAFRSGEAQLRDRLQGILGIEVQEFVTQLDAETGINTVIIRLAKRLDLVLPPVSGNEFEVKHLA